MNMSNPLTKIFRAAVISVMVSGLLYAQVALAGLEEVKQCIATTAGCGVNYAKTYVSAMETLIPAMEFISLHENCVADYTNGNPVTIGISSGIVTLAGLKKINTDDIYGQGGKELAVLLSSFIPVQSLKDIADSSQSQEVIKGQLQTVALTIPIPSVAVPTLDLQLGCGTAMAKAGKDLIEDIKAVVNNVKATVQSCSAAASCIGKGLVSVAGAAYNEGKKVVAAVNSLDSLWQDANIPAGEYFKTIWYPQMTNLATVYALYGGSAGGDEMAKMYTTCHDYYDSHRMSGESATETCDLIRGWGADSNQPWTHTTLNELIQQFIDTSYSGLASQAYIMAKSNADEKSKQCTNNKTCIDKVTGIFNDAAATFIVPKGASVLGDNDKKLALLKPCQVGNTFNLPACLSPAFKSAQADATTWLNARSGIAIGVIYLQAKGDLISMASDRSDADFKKFTSMCNPGAEEGLKLTGGVNNVKVNSQCHDDIVKTLQKASAEIEAINMDECNKGTVDNPKFQLKDCLNNKWDKHTPELQKAVDDSNDAAKKIAYNLAVLNLQKQAADLKTNKIADFKRQCAITKGCTDKQVENEFEQAYKEAIKSGLQSCRVTDYQYDIPLCLKNSFSIHEFNLEATVQDATQGKELAKESTFLDKYAQKYLDGCSLKIGCTRALRPIIHDWYIKVKGDPFAREQAQSEVKKNIPADVMQSQGKQSNTGKEFSAISKDFINQIVNELNKDNQWFSANIDPFVQKCPNVNCKSNVIDIAEAWFQEKDKGKDADYKKRIQANVDNSIGISKIGEQVGSTQLPQQVSKATGSQGVQMNGSSANTLSVNDTRATTPDAQLKAAGCNVPLGLPRDQTGQYNCPIGRALQLCEQLKTQPRSEVKSCNSGAALPGAGISLPNNAGMLPRAPSAATSPTPTGVTLPTTVNAVPDSSRVVTPAATLPNSPPTATLPVTPVRNLQLPMPSTPPLDAASQKLLNDKACVIPVGSRSGGYECKTDDGMRLCETMKRDRKVVDCKRVN